MGIKELRDCYFSTCSPCLKEYAVIKGSARNRGIYASQRREYFCIRLGCKVVRVHVSILEKVLGLETQCEFCM